MAKKDIGPIEAVGWLLIVALVFWTGLVTIGIGVINAIRWIFGF